MRCDRDGGSWEPDQACSFVAGALPRARRAAPFGGWLCPGITGGAREVTACACLDSPCTVGVSVGFSTGCRHMPGASAPIAREGGRPAISGISSASRCGQSCGGRRVRSPARRNRVAWRCGSRPGRQPTERLRAWPHGKERYHWIGGDCARDAPGVALSRHLLGNRGCSGAPICGRDQARNLHMEQGPAADRVGCGARLDDVSAFGCHGGCNGVNGLCLLPCERSVDIRADVRLGSVDSLIEQDSGDGPFRIRTDPPDAAES